VHLAKNMALTDKQKWNIVRLDFETIKEMMHECDDLFMSVDQYHEYTGINKRTIYSRIEKGLIKATTFCGSIVIYGYGN